jgi:hypothetical protein
MTFIKRLPDCWCADCMGIRRAALLKRARLPITVALADRLCLTLAQRMAHRTVQVTWECNTLVERYELGIEQRH